MLGSIKHVNFEHVLFHPSYDLRPSPEDIEVTERIKNAGLIIGIELIDHIIVNDNEGLSLKQKGYL